MKRASQDVQDWAAKKAAARARAQQLKKERASRRSELERASQARAAQMARTRASIGLASAATSAASSPSQSAGALGHSQSRPGPPAAEHEFPAGSNPFMTKQPKGFDATSFAPSSALTGGGSRSANRTPGPAHASAPFATASNYDTPHAASEQHYQQQKQQSQPQQEQQQQQQQQHSVPRSPAEVRAQAWQETQQEREAAAAAAAVAARPQTAAGLRHAGSLGGRVVGSPFAHTASSSSFGSPLRRGPGEHEAPMSAYSRRKQLQLQQEAQAAMGTAGQFASAADLRRLEGQVQSLRQELGDRDAQVRDLRALVQRLSDSLDALQEQVREQEQRQHQQRPQSSQARGTAKTVKAAGPARRTRPNFVVHAAPPAAAAEADWSRDEEGLSGGESRDEDEEAVLVGRGTGAREQERQRSRGEQAASSASDDDLVLGGVSPAPFSGGTGASGASVDDLPVGARKKGSDPFGQAGEYADPAQAVPMQQCPGCKRSFNAKSYPIHRRACRKVFQTKRKEFHVEKVDKEASDVAKHAPKPARAAKNNWRQERARLREAIMAGKAVSKAIKDGVDLSTLPAPAVSSVPDSRVPCPHCGRKFNQQAADRHIPKCANILSNKPSKRTPSGRGGGGGGGRRAPSRGNRF